MNLAASRGWCRGSLLTVKFINLCPVALLDDAALHLEGGSQLARGDREILRQKGEALDGFEGCES